MARTNERAAGICRGLALAELLERIVRSADRIALRELHDHRSVFRLRGSRPMLLAEFVDALRASRGALEWAGSEDALLDYAYDLTIDKFAHLPVADSAPLKSSGPDCRYYLGMVVERIGEMNDSDPEMDLLDREIAAARILQNCVVRHFRLSCLEAQRRSNPARTRYAWSVPGGVLQLWIPTILAGRRRRGWLAEHVPNADAARPGERRRVQRIVDAHLGVPGRVPAANHAEPTVPRAAREKPPALGIDQQAGAANLARAVANEKAANLHKQRPAIRALGRRRVRQLILRIFADLQSGTYSEKPLAQAFGLSRPTLSRFAGSRWHSGRSARIPDLWANTAEMLTTCEAFMEAARQAGLLPRVREIAANRRISETNPKGRSDV